MKNSHLDRRSKYSIQAIRTALFRLLKEKELPSITVTEICRLADINRGTFYKYYKDVPDLYAQIETSIAEESYLIIKENCLDNFSIKELIPNILNFLVDNDDFNCLIAKNPAGTQFIRKTILSFRPRFIETMLANIPELTEETADICFDFLLGGAVNIIIQWINNGKNIPVRRLEKILIHFIDSVLNIKNDFTYN